MLDGVEPHSVVVRVFYYAAMAGPRRQVSSGFVCADSYRRKLDTEGRLEAFCFLDRCKFITHQRHVGRRRVHRSGTPIARSKQKK